MAHHRRAFGVPWIGFCALVLSVTPQADASDSIWQGGDGDWFGSPSNWQQYLPAGPVVPPGTPGGPDNGAWINSGVARVFVDTAPVAAIPISGGLWVGTENNSNGAVVSQIGMQAGGEVRVGWVGNNAIGSLTIQEGGLHESGGLVVGNAPNPGTTNAGIVDITGGITVRNEVNRVVRVGVASTNGVDHSSTEGEVVLRTGDLISPNVTVGDAQAGTNSEVTTADARGSLSILQGDLGSVVRPVKSLNIGNIWLSRVNGSEADGRVDIAGDFHYANTNSIALATSTMWSDPGNPAQFARSANAVLRVDGTAHVQAGALQIASAYSHYASFDAAVEFADADITITGGTQVGVLHSSARTTTAHGSLTITDGVASLGNLGIAINSDASNSVTGDVILGSDTTASVLTLGAGAELRFLLRDGGDSGRLTVTNSPGATTLDGELSLNILAGENLAIGDTITVLDTSLGFGGSAFDNVANGDLVASLDGSTFRVHYGASSLFDPNDVVVQAIEVVPEPASLVLLAAGLVVGRRRRGD